MNQLNIKLFFSGDEYFSTLLQLIRDAETEILFETYIFDFDPIGIQVLEELRIAKQRGVSLRLLVDGVGSYNSVNRLYDFCKKNHISFRIYHPLPFELKIIPRISWKGLQRLLFMFRRINKRNHRKIMTVDRKKILMGSFNVSQVHSEHYMGSKAWRDTGALLIFPAYTVQIENIIFAFMQAWKKASYFSKELFLAVTSSRKIKPHHDFSLFRLNHLVHWRFLLNRDLKKRIKNAKKQILITNAYFLPRRSILSHLKKAARRGVDVQLILPRKSDVRLLEYASRSLYYRLLKAGIQIYEYTPSMMHAKSLIIDDWAILGSQNLNHRSLVHDLESDLVIDDVDLKTQLHQQWKNDLVKCHQFTIKDLGRLTLFERTLYRIIYWFRYWL